VAATSRRIDGTAPVPRLSAAHRTTAAATPVPTSAHVIQPPR
jgi:hypothetical protein